MLREHALVEADLLSADTGLWGFFFSHNLAVSRHQLSFWESGAPCQEGIAEEDGPRQSFRRRSLKMRRPVGRPARRADENLWRPETEESLRTGMTAKIPAPAAGADCKQPESCSVSPWPSFKIHKKPHLTCAGAQAESEGFTASGLRRLHGQHFINQSWHLVTWFACGFVVAREDHAVDRYAEHCCL